MLPIAQLPTPLPELRSADAVSGDRIQINGQPVSAGWFWQGENARRPDRLWLPLDLLEARLGFRRVRGLGGTRWSGSGDGPSSTRSPQRHSATKSVWR